MLSALPFAEWKSSSAYNIRTYLAAVQSEVLHALSAEMQKHSFYQGMFPSGILPMLHVTAELHLAHSSAILNYLKVQVPPRCFFGCLKYPQATVLRGG